jgi:general secretion pathway protein L
MFITVIQKTAAEFILSRFEARRGSLGFIKGVKHQLDDPEIGVDDILASWADECRTDRIVLALPPAMLSLREIDLPISDRKKGREILPLELKGEMAAELDEPVFDALPLAGGRTAAIWVRPDQLSAELKVLSDKGFDPEIATFSMFSWKELLPEECEGAVAVTDGESVAVFLDRKPFFFRALPKSGERPLDTTITAVELSRGIIVANIFTIGTTVLSTEREAIPFPVSSALEATFAGDSTAASDLAAHFAMAGELLSGEPINLRRGSFIFRKDSDRLRKKLKLTWALLCVLIILVFAEAGIRYFIAQRDLSSLESSIRAIYKEAFPTRKKPVDEVAELKAEIRRLGVTGSESILATLKKLADAKGDDPREIYEVDFDGSQITGKGYDRSAQGVNEFRSKASALFGSFEVSEIKSRPDGTVGFAFRGTLKGGGK